MLPILSDLALNAALRPRAERIAFAFLLNAVLVRLKRDHPEAASTTGWSRQAGPCLLIQP